MFEELKDINKQRIFIKETKDVNIQPSPTELSPKYNNISAAPENGIYINYMPLEEKMYPTNAGGIFLALALITVLPESNSR